MLTTTHGRLRYARKYVLKISQAAIAYKLGITDAAVTFREKGTTKITARDADILYKTYGINPDWLLHGKGEMMQPQNMVGEPLPEYIIPQGCDKKKVRQRFIQVVEEYMRAHNIDTVRELCERWDLNETQVSNVFSDKTKRDVSINMLMSALYYGNINLNYVVCGRGEMFLSFKKLTKK